MGLCVVVPVYTCGVFTDKDPQLSRSIKAASVWELGSVADLCPRFPTRPFCSGGANMAPGRFVGVRRSHARLVGQQTGLELGQLRLHDTLSLSHVRVMCLQESFFLNTQSQLCVYNVSTFILLELSPEFTNIHYCMYVFALLTFRPT